MQGVNVMARWVDPTTDLASRAYAAASVSGFMFRGYAGNPVNGPNDGSGQPFDRFGSDDAAVEFIPRTGSNRSITRHPAPLPTLGERLAGLSGYGNTD